MENVTHSVIWEVGEYGRNSEDTEGSIAFHDLWQVITAGVWCIVSVGGEQQLLFALTAPDKIRSDGLSYELSRWWRGIRGDSAAISLTCDARRLPPEASSSWSYSVTPNNIALNVCYPFIPLMPGRLWK